MTAAEIVIPKIRQERLFPELLPMLNSTNLGVQYLSELRRRLNEWKPKYRFRTTLIPHLETLPFYQDILSDEGERADEIVAEKLLDFFRHDREVIVRVMKLLELDVGIPYRSGNTFLRLYRKYLDHALQELSRDKGDGSYIITVEEIPGLERGEGISSLVEKIVSRYRADNGLLQESSVSEAKSEVLVETETESMADGMLEKKEPALINEEKQELRKEVETLKEEVADV